MNPVLHFERWTLDGELPEGLRQTYGTLAERLEKISERLQEAVGQTQTLMATPAEEVTSKSLDAMRTASAKVMGLWREELAARQELATWTHQVYAPALGELQTALRQRVVDVRADVRAKLDSIGFSAEAVGDGARSIVERHPQIVAAQRHASQINGLCMAADHDNLNAGNAQRIRELRELLAEAMRKASGLLAEMSVI